MTHVRTYAQDLLARDSGDYSGHMVSTLAEMVRSSFYHREGGDVEQVYITWHRLDSLGYTSTGEYFGSGAPVYAVDCDTIDSARTFWVRAPNRQALRIALKKLYPLAKIAL